MAAAVCLQLLADFCWLPLHLHPASQQPDDLSGLMVFFAVDSVFGSLRFRAAIATGLPMFLRTFFARVSQGGSCSALCTAPTCGEVVRCDIYLTTTSSLRHKTLRVYESESPMRSLEGRGHPLLVDSAVSLRILRA